MNAKQGPFGNAKLSLSEFLTSAKKHLSNTQTVNL